MSPGPYPVGKLKGYAITPPDALVESIWKGKNFYYARGARHGTVFNNILGIFEFIRASFYPTIAPIDGKAAYAIDYKDEILSFLTIDFLRKLQNNLYLGFVSIRGFEKIPIVYFILESV